jgi:hypothetical protein
MIGLAEKISSAMMSSSPVVGAGASMTLPVISNADP